jgi:4-hydroxy 2-oxovalerate aldolase
MKNNNQFKVTAVIPVKKTSTRCANKNIREFSDTNLLELKIKTLKKVSSIHKIVVTSDSEEMLKIASNLDVATHKRDPRLCTNDNPGEFFRHLAEIVKTEILLHAPCTTPFITVEEYEEAISLYFKKHNEHDSVNCTTKLQEFLWDGKKPLNYDFENPVPSQELPSYDILNFGFNIISKKLVIKNENIVGQNPLFIHKDNVRGFDIDDQLDFTLAELLSKNGISDENDIADMYDRKCDINKIKLIDCTIRDGGYLNNWKFNLKQVRECYRAVSRSGYDYFEIGFRANPTFIKNKGRWCYSHESDIKKVLEFHKGCKIAVMAKVGTFRLSDFKKKKESSIDMVRVLLARTTHTSTGMISEYNKTDIKEANRICDGLIERGYEVCMNLGCGDLMNKREIKMVCEHFHDSKISALYLADTYGGFNDKTTASQLQQFYRELRKYDSKLNFGFHSHANNEDGFQKTDSAIYHGCKFIDSCIGGMGRGAGNLKSELFLLELIRRKKRNLQNVFPLIRYYEAYIMSKAEYRENMHRPTYHPYYAISGILSLHPNYILEILENVNSSLNQDFRLIQKINQYTLKHDCRNYDKNLISKLLRK